MRVSKNQVTLLSAAVAALFTAGANAQVVLAPNNTSATAAQGSAAYASEIANNTAIGTTGITVNTIFGVGTSANTTRHVKFTLNNATFAATVTNAALNGVNTVVAPNVPANMTPTVALGGGVGSNSVIFQITAGPNGVGISDGISFNMSAGVNVPSTASTVSVTYEVYETLGNARDGVNSFYTRTGNIATFTPTFVFRNSATTLPTQVATAISGFRAFNFGAVNSSAVAANTAVVGRLDLAAVAAPGLTPAGVTASLAAVLSGTNNSQVTVTGDFSAAAGNSAVTLNGVAANTGFTTSTAVFNVTASNGFANSAINYAVNGTAAAPVSTYSASLTAAGAAGYKTTQVSAITTGNITRDGVQLESPWVTATPGFISRFFILQTSGSTITWNATVRNAAGLVTGGALSGSLTSGSLTPVTLASLLPADTTAFPGPYQVTFNIGADASATQATYVLTSPNSSVSNTPLYRSTQQ